MQSGDELNDRNEDNHPVDEMSDDNHGTKIMFPKPEILTPLYGNYIRHSFTTMLKQLISIYICLLQSFYLSKY